MPPSPEVQCVHLDAAIGPRGALLDPHTDLPEALLERVGFVAGTLHSRIEAASGGVARAGFAGDVLPGDGALVALSLEADAEALAVEGVVGEVVLCQVLPEVGAEATSVRSGSTQKRGNLFFQRGYRHKQIRLQPELASRFATSIYL